MQNYLTILRNKKTGELINCLIQIISKQYISFYDINKLRENDKIDFFRLVNQWWLLNSSLPVSIFYPKFFRFDYCKTYLQNNEYVIESGFEGIRLKNLSDKRIKRKVIRIE